MKSLNLAKIFPCATFFADGRPFSGVTALLMQATVVLWPVAARWAHESIERTGIERLLNELSETNRSPSDPYRDVSKKFRQLA